MLDQKAIFAALLDVEDSLSALKLNPDDIRFFRRYSDSAENLGKIMTGFLGCGFSFAKQVKTIKSILPIPTQVLFSLSFEGELFVRMTALSSDEALSSIAFPARFIKTAVQMLASIDLGLFELESKQLELFPKDTVEKRHE